MSYSETESQQLNSQLEKINSLVAKYVGEIKTSGNNNSIEDCIPGTSCYANKISKNIEDAYFKALENAKFAPSELQDAEKKYLTDKLGENEYRKFLIESASKKANDEAIKLFDKFTNTLNETQYIIETLTTIFNNNLYLSDIFHQTNSNNKNLQDAINNRNTDNITKNRKSYYEQEEYTSLKRWYFFWFYIYIFLLLVFTLAIFLTESEYSFMSKMGILTLFILYLFGIKYIIIGIVNIYEFSTNVFPKNIYLNI